MIKAQSQVLEEGSKNDTSSSAQLLWFISSLSLTEDGEGARTCLSCYDRDVKCQIRKHLNLRNWTHATATIVFLVTGNILLRCGGCQKHVGNSTGFFSLAFSVPYLSNGKLNGILAFHAYNVNYYKKKIIRTQKRIYTVIEADEPPYIWSSHLIKYVRSPWSI